MGFRLYKTNGNDTRPKRYRLIKNSEVIKVGDAIIDEATGAANVDAITEAIFGIATAICTSDRISLESASVDTSKYDGAWTTSTKSYTAAVNNETVKGVLVEYIPLREGDQLLATLDAAKGTTTGSNKEGYYIAIKTSDSSLLAESTASTSSSNTQFIIRDPLSGGSTTEVVVECHLRQPE
jgi:hypothetical protein